MKRLSQRFVLAALLIPPGILATPTSAQVGSGWVPAAYTKKISIDDESGLHTLTWAPYVAVGSNTPCADYTYDSTNGAETFRIFDSRSNRSEIRLVNEYSTGRRQFEGYVTFYSPLENESLMQIFGSTTGATLMMTRGYSANGGSITVTSTGGGVTYGDRTILTGCYGQEHRINVIHDQNNYVQWYVDGVLKCEQRDTETNVVNYWKYGCYGTTSGNVPAIVVWRAVRTFVDGVPPGPELMASPGDAKVYLNWRTNSSATSYHLKRATAEGGPYVTIASPIATSYVDSGVTNGVTYYYQVSAVSGGDEGTNSFPVSVTPNNLALPGLVARYSFADGTASDVSGHGNSGTLLGNATIVNDPQRGKVLALTGSGGKVDLGNPVSLNVTGEFTATAWVKSAALGPDAQNSVLQRGYQTSPNREFALRIGNATTSPVYDFGTWSPSEFASTSVPDGDPGVWTHLAGTIRYEGGGYIYRLYRNGALVSTAGPFTNGFYDDFTVGWAIGARGGLGPTTFERVFNGMIDDVRIYNRALSQTEIQEVMSNTLDHAPIFVSEPVNKPDAEIGQAYASTLSGSATDADSGDTLAYSKISGPSWLNVAGDGGLSGTPLLGDAGTNTFVVRVADNDGFFDQTELNVRVALPQLPIVAATAGSTQTGLSPSYSYDGNETTRWGSLNDISTAWIQYDLGANYEVSGVSLLLYNGDVRTYPMRIQVDGVTVFDGSTSPGTNYWTTMFAPVTGRYVTLTMTTTNSSGNGYFAFYEAKIFGALSGMPLPPCITCLLITGGSLSIAGTNGTGSWALLQSPNLALPLGLWQTNCIATFDPSGNLSTNILNTVTNERMFYILKL